MTVREIQYDTDQTPEKVLSRLTWSVEKVEGLRQQLLNGISVETNRPWVGVYDTEQMTFTLMEPSGFFSPKFMQVLVRGHVVRSDNKTLVDLKIALGWYPVFVALMIYLSTIGMIVAAGIAGELEAFLQMGLWILAFPLPLTLLLRRKINRIEQKAEDLLGIG